MKLCAAMIMMPLFVVALAACNNQPVADPVSAFATETNVPEDEEAAVPTTAQATPVAATMADNNIGKRLDDYLRELEAAGFRGSVLVDQGGRVILSQGYGLADEAADIPNTPSTLFDIGSLTKQFTGAAILKLEMECQLQVEDFLADFLDDVPADKSAITLHHLLTHTAGFPESLGDDYTAVNRQEFIKQAMQTPLLHPPGDEYLYSNVGYSLLAAVIEIVTEQSYETYLHDALFLPAGMMHTGYLLPDWSEGEIAVGYARGRAVGKPHEQPWASDGPYWHLRGNGGILSSAEDMYRWHQALLGDDVLSAAAKTKFYHPYVEEGFGAGSYYGYGWAIFPTPRETNLITHNGGNGIFFADFWRYLDEEITIFIATNEANRDVERLASAIAQIILDPAFEPEPSTGNTAVSVTASSEFPDTEAGQTAQLLLATLQNSDDDMKKDFIEAHFSPQLFALGSLDQHVAILGQIQAEIEGLVVGPIVNEGEVIRVALLNESGVVELTLVVEVMPDDQGLLRGITFDD